MSSLIAVVTAVGAALLFGISSVADQRSTKRVKRRRALSPRILADLVRQPLWVTAVGANLAGFALQVVFPLLAAGLVVIGGCLTAAARNQNLRPLALALACGVNYGVGAFVVKLLTAEFGAGPGAVFGNWPIYVFAVVGPAGFLLNQDAFQQGRLLAPVQAIITSADPVISMHVVDGGAIPGRNHHDLVTAAHPAGRQAHTQ